MSQREIQQYIEVCMHDLSMYDVIHYPEGLCPIVMEYVFDYYGRTRESLDFQKIFPECGKFIKNNTYI